ncbi:MAG: alpha/beta hydrolase [Clostridiales bacterium]|nr:alpha/beta hydrolase [Clostridiales bacterium]
MRHERIDIWNEGEYSYPAAFGFKPNLRTYLHEDEQVRPCVLVIPGGGYRVVSPTEGEIVAKCFYKKGYQCFVGTYTTDFLGIEPLKSQPLKDISRMLRIIRSRAGEFCLRPDRIVVCGFSAGAHLCGSLCVHWQDVDDPSYAGVSNRPDGAILSYPVITSGEFAHRDSFRVLLGEGAGEAELRYASLETQVNAQTPPVFMWQTALDELVPVENSYLMALALKDNGIPFEHHVFPKGQHGLSLSNEDWEYGRFGEQFEAEQLVSTARAVEEGTVEAPPEKRKMLMELLHPEQAERKDMPFFRAVKEVSVWPQLADVWMRENL